MRCSAPAAGAPAAAAAGDAPAEEAPKKVRWLSLVVIHTNFFPAGGSQGGV